MIMPATKKIKLFAPLSYGKVSDGIMRSAYPTPRNYPFLDTLNIKTFLCLCPVEIRNELREYARSKDIKILEFDVKRNQDPFLSMDNNAVSQAVAALLDTANYPILIFCLNGKAKTACVIGCYRKVCNWSITGLAQEFELFAEPEGGISDLLFIERFQYLSESRIS